MIKCYLQNQAAEMVKRVAGKKVTGCDNEEGCEKVAGGTETRG